MAVCDAHPGLVHKPDQHDQPDLHHLLPREWQRHWQPANAPYPGTYAGEQLWDARGIKVPPTCHHNVHHWIVLIMQTLALREGTLDANAVLTVADVIEHTYRSKWTRLEIAQAQQAPLYFLQAGGDLRVLTDAHLWGAI